MSGEELEQRFVEIERAILFHSASGPVALEALSMDRPVEFRAAAAKILWLKANEMKGSASDVLSVATSLYEQSSDLRLREELSFVISVYRAILSK